MPARSTAESGSCKEISLRHICNILANGKIGASSLWKNSCASSRAVCPSGFKLNPSKCACRCRKPCDRNGKVHCMGSFSPPELRRFFNGKSPPGSSQIDLSLQCIRRTEIRPCILQRCSNRYRYFYRIGIAVRCLCSYRIIKTGEL